MRFLVNIAAMLLMLPDFSAFAAETDAKPLILKLEDIKLDAVELSPSLAAQRSQLEVILAEIEQESLPENPQLQGEVQFPQHYPDERGDNEYEVSLSQKLRMGDFGKRGAVSSLISRQKTIESQLQLLKTMQEISLLYYRLWALQQEEQNLKKLRLRADKLGSSIESLASEGRIDEKSRGVALSSAARIAARQEAVKFEVAGVSAALSKKVGKDLRKAGASKPELPKLPKLEELKQMAERSENGVHMRTQLMTSLAEEQQELAKSEAFPALTPKLSFSHNDEGKDFVGVGLSFDLPIFQRNDANKARARGAYLRAKKIRDYINNGGFDTEIEAAYVRIKSKHKQAKIYENKVRPALTEALDAALTQYENGQISVIELWQIEKEYSETFDESLSLWIDTFAALGELELLIGNEL